MAFDNEAFEEENFAEMLEASFKEQESTRITEGEIVEIQEGDNRALVGVGEKLEGIISLDEIRDASGKLLFNVGDKITVMITGHYNERPKISYKKVLEQEKTLAFINAHKDDFESVIINAKDQIVATCRPTDLSKQSPTLGAPALEALYGGRLRGWLPATGVARNNGLIASLSPVPGFADLRVLTVLPDGSEMLELNGTIEDYTIIQLDANGQKVVRCVEDPKAAAQPLPPAPQREDR